MLKKITDIALETTSSYREKSKLNVRLWNQDKGVSVLKFLVTRDNFPLSLSSENVKMIIVIENGENFISSEDFEISSEVDGVASFQIPDDFMATATGECVAQVYVGTLDNDEVVVYRQITFEISQDLLSSIPSELKLQYIKTFSDLSDSISTRLLQIEEDMATMEDYVVAVNQATTDGLTALNNLVNAKTVEYNDNHADKLALINNTVDGYVQDFLDQRSYIDTKYAEFQTAVGGSGLVTVGDAEGWQKYKLTKDDGTRTYLPKGSFEDVNALEPGLYETVSTATPTQGFPSVFGSGSYIEIDVTQSDQDRKQITVTQSSRGQTFVKFIHTDGLDNGWKEIAYVNESDPFETINGSSNKANTAENNAKQYTDSKVQSINTVLFEGTANGVNTTINLNESLDNFIVLYIFATFPGGTVPILGNPYGTSVIPIQLTNITDGLGQGGGVYEAILSKTSRTQLKITNDVFYDLGSGEGSGANANKITITKIVGVRNI